ncbi:MAG: hypothetical protein GXP35_09135, partial [Actinobacteria bacterium]|nr:hypothetical protein [Actinomycetota bacterium]
MTDVQRVCVALSELRRGEVLDASKLGDLFDDDIVYDDRRSVVSAGRFVGKTAMIEMSVATHSLGLSDDVGNEAIALRGESLVLSRSDLVDQAGNRIERLLLVSLGASGKIAHLATFDSDDIDAAYDELDRLYRESLLPELRERFDEQQRVLEAIVTGDVDVIRELYAPEFMGTDHRLLGFGDAIDLETYTELIRQRPLTLGRGTGRLRDHVFFGRAVAVTNVTINTTSSEFGVESAETLWSVNGWRGGQMVSQGVYNPSQREEAFACARELASSDPEPQPSLANACTRSGDRQIALMLDEHRPEPPEGLFSPDFVHDDRRSTVNSGLTKGSEAETVSYEALRGIAAIDDIRATTLAIRGDHLAMLQVVIEINDFVVEFLAVESIDTQGRRDRTVMFDPGDVPAAEAELDRLWMKTLSNSDADLVRRVRECGEAVMFGDSDKVGTFLSADFVATDSRTLGWGSLDRTGRLQFIGERPTTIGDGYL